MRKIIKKTILLKQATSIKDMGSIMGYIMKDLAGLVDGNMVQNIVKKVTGLKPKLSTSGGTSDARFIKNIAPCLEFGLVGKTMHKIDESVSVSDLKKLTKIYENILVSYFK